MENGSTGQGHDQGTPVRVYRRAGWVTVPNDPLYDPSLSLKAKGLLAYMLAKPHGWRFSAGRIAAECRDGRDSVLTGVRELTAAGYVRYRTVRAERGRFVSWYEVRDHASVEWPTGDGSTGDGFSGSGEPGRSQTKEVETKENKPCMGLETPLGECVQREHIPSSSLSATDFDTWWAEYPRKVGKADARRAYQARIRAGTDPDTLLAALRNYTTSTRGTALCYIKYAATFLHGPDGPWSEWASGPPQGATSGRWSRNPEIDALFADLPSRNEGEAWSDWMDRIGKVDA